MGKVERVGVVGAGTMGAGIAEVCIRGGCDTIVVEVEQQSIAIAQERITAALEKSVLKGQMTPKERDEAFGRLLFCSDLGAMAAVRAAFDPEGRANPGKVIPTAQCREWSPWSGPTHDARRTSPDARHTTPGPVR